MSVLHDTSTSAADRIAVQDSPTVLGLERGALPDVSVVVPLMNEQDTLAELFAQVRDVCDADGLTFEVVFVDDGSTDGSAEVVAALSRRDPRANLVRLHRNSGKAAALSVGLARARGATVVTMDADLQDDPAEIPGLLAMRAEGYDVVSGWKKERHDPLSRRLASKVFNAGTRKMSGMTLHDFNCGIKAYSNDAAKDIAASCYGELHRYLPMLAHHQGYRVGEKVVHHKPRAVGKSRYGLERYVRGGVDLVTTVYYTRYTRRPMHLFGGVGVGLLVVGMLAAVLAVVLSVAGIGSAAPIMLAAVAAVSIAVAVPCFLLGLVAEMLTVDKATAVPHTVVTVETSASTPDVPARSDR